MMGDDVSRSAALTQCCHQPYKRVLQKYDQADIEQKKNRNRIKKNIYITKKILSF